MLNSNDMLVLYGQWIGCRFLQIGFGSNEGFVDGFSLRNFRVLDQKRTFVCILRDIRRKRFLTDFVPCSWRIGSSGQEAGIECASREAKILLTTPAPRCLDGWKWLALNPVCSPQPDPDRAANLDRPRSRAFACSPQSYFLSSSR